MQEHITEKLVERLRSKARGEEKEIYCWCTEYPNFGVRASPSGLVTFLVQKWSKGKAIRRAHKLHYPHLKVKAAHDWAAIELAKIVQGTSGTDQTNLSTERLEATFNKWFEQCSKPGSHWREIQRSFTVDVIPALGANTYVKHISKAKIRELIVAKQIDAPAMARTLFAVMMPFFKWCVETEIITTSPMATMTRPAAGKSRDRYLSPDEIVKLWHAATAIGYPYGHFYKLALLLGQRNETEIGLMKWEEIQDSVWTIPAERVKNKQEHIVHISPLAQAVLASIPRTSEYVFTIKGKPITGFASAKVKIDALLQYTKPWVVHDLRRTIVTHMVDKLKVKPDVSDRILNHIGKARSGIAGVYGKWELVEERKTAMELYSNWIEGLISSIRP